MQRRAGSPLFVAVLALFVAGCSRESGEFREYASDGKDLPGTDSGEDVRGPAEAPKPRRRRGAGLPIRDVGLLSAAVGAGGRAVLNPALAMQAEQWLTPAVGGGPTLTTLRWADPSRRKKASPAAGATAVARRDASKRQAKLLIPQKTFREEGPNGALRVSYDDIDLLKVLNMEPVTPEAPKMMPDWMKELDGKQVRIRGFMSPSFMQTGITQFLLGRDNKACCFPGKAKVYDLFPVKLSDGVTTDFISNRPFDVVGTFHIKPWVLDGKLVQIYTIVDARIVR